MVEEAYRHILSSSWTYWNRKTEQKVFFKKKIPPVSHFLAFSSHYPLLFSPFSLILLLLPRWTCDKLPGSVLITFFFKKKKRRATNAQKKSWKERKSACKCSNYSSSNAPVMDTPISFNAGLLSQLTSPAWFLIFELNLNRATYNSSRLTRGLSVVTGRVGRIVSMFLHTHTHTKKKTPPSDGGKKAFKLFRNARKSRFIFSFFLWKWMGGRQLYRQLLCLAQRQWITNAYSFCSRFPFPFRAEFYAVNSWNVQLNKWKRQFGSLLSSSLETSNVSRKHPLPEHECITAACIEPPDFLSP